MREVPFRLCSASQFSKLFTKELWIVEEKGIPSLLRKKTCAFFFFFFFFSGESVP